ncbi:uncharacterized protein [Eurosta solidaginis]|uniref:uncharacterized protein n=1 Tax=Eurosta solidaginis TaxID=178769 RepID=UPI003530D920
MYGANNFTNLMATSHSNTVLNSKTGQTGTTEEEQVEELVLTEDGETRQQMHHLGSQDRGNNQNLITTSLNNSELFSLNILSALEADGMNNRDPADTEFSQLILEWGFPQKIAELKAQAITLTNLKYLTESDLADLFKNDTIGARAEFRQKLINWRKANGYSNVSTCDTASVNSDIVDFMQQWRQRNIGIESPSCSQPSSSSSHDFDLQQVLNAHPNGEYVLRLGKLEDAGRKILIDATVYC